MPRGKKNLTLEERIQAIDTEIEEKKQAIVVLKEQKAALEKEKKQKDIEALYEVLKESGKTVDDIKALIK